jgi:hypothetical protein
MTYIAGIARCRACGATATLVRRVTSKWPKHEGRCDECREKALVVPAWWPVTDPALVSLVEKERLIDKAIKHSTKWLRARRMN